MNLSGTEYYYIRNAQGDITGLFDKNGTTVVEYTYDSWGKLISTTGSLASTVGAKNPYRYRGYRYDSETGLYYLQSRYYNPTWGRFINADSYIGTPGELLSHNVFIYSLNNPVNRVDPSGYWSFNVLKQKVDELILKGCIFVYVQAKFIQTVINNKIKNVTGKILKKIGGEVVDDVASMAKKWQGNGSYPGVDNWKNTTIKKGTKVWGGAPGQSNFYTTEEVMKSVGNDATKLYQGLQVGKGNFPLFRPGMTQYEVMKDTTVGYSKALANPQYGAGGFDQYFINAYENVLKPIKSIIMTNR